MSSLQQAFESLVKDPEHPQANENLKLVALALWFEDFVPNVENLDKEHAAQAGFVLDKLTRYNCLERIKKDHLRSQLLPVLKRQSAKNSTTERKDKLAADWGACYELKNEFRALLPYQRRHYHHVQAGVSA